MANDLASSMEKDIKRLRDGAYIENAPKDSDELDGDYEDKDSCTQLWEDWQLTRDYLAARNVPNCIRMWEDYYEDRQRKYMPKSLPNVWFNYVGSIIRQKQSTICESPVQLDFFSNESIGSSTEMTRFINFIMKSMGFERALRSGVKWGLVRGNFFLHFYWCEDGIGEDSIAKGTCKVEEIHTLNVGVCNPNIKNIQDQEWVIVATREKVKKVRAMCEKKSDIEKIVHDDNEVNDQLVEQDENELVTVLTRYFRIDNEVYFEKGTKNVMLHSPKPLNPEISYKNIKNSRKRDPQMSASPDEKLTNEQTVEEQHNKFYLYPLVCGTLSESSDSYLGLSDVEGMVPGQNAINVMYSLAVKNGIDIQPKYLKKEDALRGQDISNQTGEVITDYHKGAGDGLKIITGVATMSNEMLNFPLAMGETLKKIKASADVTMGDVSKEYSATAISLLQTAAEKPTEDMERQKELAAEDAGKIILLFAKFYFRNARYVFAVDDREQLQLAEEYKLPKEAIPNRLEGRFNGTKYMTDIFEIQVNAGPGGKLSQATQFQFLVQFFQLQGNMTPDQKRTFIKATPSYILNDKTELLALVDAEEQGTIAQMKAQVDKLQQAIQTYDMGTKEMATIIDILQRYISQFSKEAGSAIETRDKAIGSLTGAQAQAQITNSPTVKAIGGGDAGTGAAAGTDIQ